MTNSKFQQLGNAAGVVGVISCVIWLAAAILTEPNIWFADIAHKLVLPFVLISVALRMAARRAEL